MIPTAIAAALGKPTFHEDWAAFDHGPDLTPAGAHRWRTILQGSKDQYGRNITGHSFGADETIGFPDSFVQRPGTLIMQCNKVRPDQVRPETFGKPYAGAQITTKFSFSQKFGYFEGVFRIPRGVGPYPGFWLMPAPPPGVSMPWPKGGEIDIFECLGNPNYIYQTVHSSVLPLVAGQRQTQRKIALGFDASAGVHRYGVAWDADEIVWFVDRKETFRIPTPDDMRSTPMYFLLTLGASHPWDNDQPNAATPWPMQLVCYGVNAWELRTP